MLLSFVLIWLVPESEGWLIQIHVKKRRELLHRTEWQEIPVRKLHGTDSVDSRSGWRYGGFKNLELPDELYRRSWRRGQGWLLL